MVRSKAVARLSKTRNDEAPLRRAAMANWQTERRQKAMAERIALAEDHQARRGRRADAASLVQSKLDELAIDREHLRRSGNTERSAHLVNLIIAVNEMTAAFQAAGDDRKRASHQTSAEITAFLNERSARRRELKARQVAEFQTFRLQLANAAMQARCDDFR